MDASAIAQFTVYLRHPFHTAQSDLMTKHYPVEQRERAVKMVLDHLAFVSQLRRAGRRAGQKRPWEG